MVAPTPTCLRTTQKMPIFQTPSIRSDRKAPGSGPLSPPYYRYLEKQIISFGKRTCFLQPSGRMAPLVLVATIDMVISPPFQLAGLSAMKLFGKFRPSTILNSGQVGAKMAMTELVTIVSPPSLTTVKTTASVRRRSLPMEVLRLVRPTPI